MARTDQEQAVRRSALNSVFEQQAAATTSAVESGQPQRISSLAELSAAAKQRRASQPQRAAINPNQNQSGIGDVVTGLEIGARQIPGILTGLADIPAGLVGFDRPFDRLSDAVGSAIGVDNDATIERLRGELTPETRAAQSAVSQAQGFGGTLSAALDNPRAIGMFITESIPSTLAGGGIGGAIAKTAAKQVAKQTAKTGSASAVANVLSKPAVAAGLGEGAVAAGASMDSINKDVSARKAAAAALATGFATAGISTAGATVARKLGIGDPDLILVGGRTTLAPGVKRRGIAKRILYSGVSEGIFQEMPQGSFEQIATNWAEDNPLLEGVSNAAVTSMLSGMGMGAGAGALNIGGPQEFIEPTPESEDTSGDPVAENPVAKPPSERVKELSDSRLVGNLVTLGQFYEGATTDEQRKSIGEHLRTAQREMVRRGIPKEVLEKESAQAEFEKTANRIEKNQRNLRGLAAQNVDKADKTREQIDKDVERLITIERVYPGARQRHIESQVTNKYEQVLELQKRVQKNASKKSRASEKTKRQNREALKAATLELEILAEDNPHALEALERVAEAERAVETPDEQVGRETPTVPVQTVPADQEASAIAQAAAAGKQRKGKKGKKAKKNIDPAVKRALDALGPFEEGTEIPDTPPTEEERRQAQADAPIVRESPEVKERIAKLLGATQSTAGLSPEPSTKPVRVPDERPVPVQDFARKPLTDGTKKMYLRKGGKLTKRAEKDITMFEEMDIPNLVSVLEEYQQRTKRGPLVIAQEELIQSMLDTTRAEEYDAWLEQQDRALVDQSPLTADEMTNILLDAEDAADAADRLSFREREVLEAYNQYAVIEGSDNPIARIQRDEYRKSLAEGGEGRIPDAKHLRKVSFSAANKLVRALMKRRGLRTRREAQALLGPLFRSFTRGTPSDSKRMIPILNAMASGDPNELRIELERARVRRALGQDIVRAKNNAPGGFDDLLADAPEGVPINKADAEEQAAIRAFLEANPEFTEETADDLDADDILLQQQLSTRGSVNETSEDQTRRDSDSEKRLVERLVEEAKKRGDSPAEIERLKAQAKLRKSIKTQLKAMGIFDATPAQVTRLRHIAAAKDDYAADLDIARRGARRLEVLGEQYAELAAHPQFDDFGKAWNKAAKRIEKRTGQKIPRWKKASVDPWVLSNYIGSMQGIEQQVERGENETREEFNERLTAEIDRIVERTGNDLAKRGTWLNRVDATNDRINQLELQLETAVAAETEIFNKLGANLDAKEEVAKFDSPSVTPGPVPQIYYPAREERPRTPQGPRQVRRGQAVEEDLRQDLSPAEKQRRERARNAVEPGASTFKNSPFAIGSMRTVNPDLEVAALFADPSEALRGNNTQAIVVTTTAEKFLQRAAELRAEFNNSDPADELRALKAIPYSNAAAALKEGKKLTSPTLDRRWGEVKNIEHVLANMAAGDDKVHFVELVLSQQAGDVSTALEADEAVTNSYVVDREVIRTTDRATPPTVPGGPRKKTGAKDFVWRIRATTEAFMQRAAETLARKSKRSVEEELADLMAMDTRVADRLFSQGGNPPAPIIDRKRFTVKNIEHVVAAIKRGSQPTEMLFNEAAASTQEDAVLREIAATEGMDAMNPVKEDYLYMPVPRLSLTQRPVQQPETVAGVKAAVQRYVPQGKQRRVTVVQSFVDLENMLAREGIEVSGTAGGITHNGKVYLIADNIEAGTAGGVLMHEVGVHLSLKPATIQRFAKAIRDMAAQGNEFARNALDAVDGAADTMAGYGTMVTDLDVDHEVVAYFVENAVNAGVNPSQLGRADGPVRKFFRNLLTAIRASMRALGLSGKALTAQDVVDAAYGAADTVFREPVGDMTPRMSLGIERAAARVHNKWVADNGPSRRAWETLKFHTVRLGSRFTFTKDLVDAAAKSLPSAGAYFEIINRLMAARTSFDAQMQKHMNRAKEFTQKEYDAMNHYLYQSQLKEAWGFEPHEGAFKPEKQDEELQSLFKAMSREQQQYIRDTFEFADNLQKEREAVMRGEISAATAEAVKNETDPEEQAKIIARGARDLSKFDRDFAGRRAAWLPLRRTGNYAATFISDELRTLMDESPTDPRIAELKSDPQHYIVEFHLSARGAKDAAAAFQENAAVAGRAEMFEREAMLDNFDMIPGHMMLAMQQQIENLEDEKASAGLQKAWKNLYVESLRETSIRKSELARMMIGGADKDMIKSFVQYGSAVGGTISGIKMGRETYGALRQIREEAGPRSGVDSPRDIRSVLKNEILERHMFMINPDSTPITDKVMGATSLNLLLSSPAYFMQNSTQPWLMTLPALGGTFGLAKSAGKMSSNYKVISKAWKAEHSFKPNQLNKLLSGELADLEVIREELGDDVAEMMEKLQDLGLFDIGIAADLGSLEQTEYAVTNAIAKAHRGLTHAVRTVEVFNRGVTAITAYQLAKENPKAVPIGPNGKRPNPTQYAIDQVYLTQGDYSGQNAPSMIRRAGWPGKLIGQFRKFQLIQIGMLVRIVGNMRRGAGAYEKAMARRQLAYVLGAHGLAGGALGLPMANIAGMVFALFNDEDEPDDLEVRLRQEIGDSDAADLILKGLPAFWNVDISGKVGMGQTFSVMPFTDIKFTKQGFNEAAGALVFGAAGATGGQLFDAGGQLAKGNYPQAFASAMPRGIRDATRAWMYATQGVQRKNPTRDTAISADEFSALDIFMQGVGLPTTKVTGMQSRNRFYQNYKQLLGDRSSVIKGDYVRAYEANDHRAMQDARNAWTELQQARRRNGFPAQSAALLNRAIRDKRKREATAVDGVFVNRNEQGYLDLMK